MGTAWRRGYAGCMNLLDVTVHAVFATAPKQFPVTVEAIPANEDLAMPEYYRVELAGVRYCITDAHRLQIIEALASAPRFPESDAQIDPTLDEYGCTKRASLTELWDRAHGVIK